ncbi:MAG TPA: VWA domain-containing protein [Jatrophihabitans sp.]|uniref:vWA domain-containing protein n=1 Tax=Jatrophihabitans sp. TaxID=1932789 RepID=UPI002E0C512A|nr:VWA domain-containing protein [Jatrophihabitans sp.]
MTQVEVPDPVITMTGFARALRANGIAADATRLTTALDALTHVDPMDAEQVYWAGRVTLCAEPDDLPRYDAVFDAWFRGRVPPLPGPSSQGPPAQVLQLRPIGGNDGQGDDAEPDDEQLRTAASDTEILRHRDVTGLTELERDEINQLIALLAPKVGSRRTRRRRPRGRDHVDISRTVRTMLRDGGEPATLARFRPRVKPRRLVLLLDVSGSMSPYADVLLRFAHAAVRVAPNSTEVFTVSTRLTRITRQLRLRDPEQALAAAGSAVPDWSGGTRLGESLRAFLDLWGQRGTARRAVVVLASDGWERGDAELLGEQMARLARLAYKLIWVNPHRGKEGFAPATAGMTAALPHLDELLAGHTLDALHTLADVIADA